MESKEIISGAVHEFTKRVEEFAGAEVRQKVVQGGLTVSDDFNTAKGALEYKEAIERMEKLVDKPTCEKIMTACGCTCQSIYDQGVLKLKEKRHKYTTEEAFLADLTSLDSSTRIERKDKDLIQCFSPGKMFPNMPGLRCACMLIGGLPEDVYASPAVCECSRGFTEKRWETILGRPVRVEVIDTPIISKTDECRFIIHL